MANGLAQQAQASLESEKTITSEPQNSVWSKFVIYNDQRDGERFQWSDAGRHGLTILRKCALLQHVSKSCVDQGTILGDPARRDSPPCCSGAARCLSLTRVDLERSGILVGAAAAFLEVVWTELRHVALCELREYAAVMEALEQKPVRDTPEVGSHSTLLPAAPPAAALLTTLLHMWRRCPLWAALHRAPADLLGELNESALKDDALAPTALAALRSTTGILIVYLWEGLRQLGQGLARWEVQCTAAAHAGEHGSEMENMHSGGAWSDAGGRLTEVPNLNRSSSSLSSSSMSSWLLGWRMYLEVHRLLLLLEESLLDSGHPEGQRSGPSWADLETTGTGRPPLAPGSLAATIPDRVSESSASIATRNSLGGKATFVTTGPVADNTVGLLQPFSTLSMVVSEPRRRWISSRGVPPSPGALLEGFLSECALQAVAQVLAPRDGSGSHGYSEAGVRVLVGDRPQRTACWHMLMQLREVLGGEELSAEGVAQRLQLNSHLPGCQSCASAAVATAAAGAAHAAADATVKGPDESLSGPPSGALPAGDVTTAPIPTSVPTATPTDIISLTTAPPPRRNRSINDLGMSDRGTSLSHTPAAWLLLLPGSTATAIPPMPATSLALTLTRLPATSIPPLEQHDAARVGRSGAVLLARTSTTPGASAPSGTMATPPCSTSFSLPGGPLGIVSSEPMARLGGSSGLWEDLGTEGSTPSGQPASDIAAGPGKWDGGAGGGVVGGRDDSWMRHARRAALLYGTCFLLHGVHCHLEAVHCVAAVASPNGKGEEEEEEEQKGEPLGSEAPADSDCDSRLRTGDPTALLLPAAAEAWSAALPAPPCNILLQLPGEPLAGVVDAVAWAAGATALAAAGAQPLTPSQVNGTDGSLMAEAIARAAAWVTASCRRHASCNGGSEAAGLGGAVERASEFVAQSASAAEEGVEVVAVRGVSWVCGVEARMAGLLENEAEAAGAEYGSRVNQSGGGKDREGGRISLLHQALLLAAGRLRRLAISVSPVSGSSGLLRTSVYCWGSPGTPAAAAASIIVASIHSSSTSATAMHGSLCGMAAKADAAVASLAAPSARALLLHLAVCSCAAATNHLTHLAGLHNAAAGSGTDLRPLCRVHSDAVTLGAAARVLMHLMDYARSSVRNLLYYHQLQQHRARRRHNGGRTWRKAAGGEAPKVLGGPDSGSSYPSTVSSGAEADGSSAEGPTAWRGAQPQSKPPNARSPNAAADGGDNLPTRQRLSDKLNWRRPLRRIMPYHRAAAAVGSVSNPGIGMQVALAGTKMATGPGSGSGHNSATATTASLSSASFFWGGGGVAVVRRRAVSRACWRSDAVEPMPLPHPAPLCSIATPHLEAAAEAQLLLRPSTTLPQQWLGLDSGQARAAYRVSFDPLCGGSGDGAGLEEGGDGGSREEVPSTDGNGGPAGAARLQAPLVPPPLQQGDHRSRQSLCSSLLTDVEVGLLELLRAACEQLGAAAARAGNVVEEEMGHRAAMICSSTARGGGGSTSGSAGDAEAAGASSAPQRVVSSLLRPLREALAGLHPVSQSELLSRGFTAVLQVLREQYPARGGGDAALNHSRGFRGALGAGGLWSREHLEVGMALWEEEVEAGWRQVEAALGTSPGPGVAGGRGLEGEAGSSRTEGEDATAMAARAWVTGEYDFKAVRAELESRLRKLRSEVGVGS